MYAPSEQRGCASASSSAQTKEMPVEHIITLQIQMEQRFGALWKRLGD